MSAELVDVFEMKDGEIISFLYNGWIYTKDKKYKNLKKR